MFDQLGAEVRSLANHPRWVPEDRSYSLMLLTSTFPELHAKLQLNNTEMWSEFAQTTECELHFPVEVKKVLTPFQVVMTIQTLRPDRLHSAMASFAQIALGRLKYYFIGIEFCSQIKLQLYLTMRYV